MDKIITILVVLLVGVAGTVGFNAFLNHTAAPVYTPPLGGLAGPDIPSPYLNWGDLPIYNARVPLATQSYATTTLCNILSPSSTSTLTYAALRLDTGSTTGMLIDIAKSTAPDATTTAIGSSYNVLANKAASINASTTIGVAGQVNIFAPNTWLVIKAGLSTAGAVGTFSSTGNCSAQFVVN